MDDPTPPRPPPRLLAITLVATAATALLLPVWYTIKVHDTFGPFGSLIAWTTASVGLLGTLTVLLSVVRHFVRPAIETLVQERNL